MKVTFVDAGGQAREVEATAGKSLMQAALKAGVAGIEADCGGLMTCATCHVYVRQPWADALPPPTDEECGMLEFAAAGRQPTSRLSCQIVLEPGLESLVVDLPVSQY